MAIRVSPISIISKRGMFLSSIVLAELARKRPLIDGTSSTRCSPSEQLKKISRGQFLSTLT